jgi:hypothetical protein
MMHLFRDEMGRIVSAAMKDLLCTKHLYQSVEVNLLPLVDVSKRIREEISAGGPSLSSTRPPKIPATAADILVSGVAGVNVPWAFMGRIEGSVRELVPFVLPSINTFCNTCESRPPFNPVDEMGACVLDPNDEQNQWYELAYQCQQCKGTPVRFLIRRQGLKLRLCGRDPIEAVPAPKVLPKAPSKFFSAAQIAYHAGQTLAAIFLLRTFIEQFWRSLPEVQAVLKAQPRATGDEQGMTYQNTLPVDFRSRFPSLSEIYGKLSAAMHEANEDATLFEECCQKVEEHFDARRLFKMVSGA